MALRGCWRALAALAMSAVVAACTVAPPQPRPASPGHLGTAPAPAVAAPAIPKPVTRAPYLPPPGEGVAEETYTVVVNDVPARELLFALARDASMNVDVHPSIQGAVTLNAIDQSLYQILDRIGRQLDVRYEQQGDTIAVVPDSPFLRTYKIDYVNVTRNSDGTISASTLVGGGVGEGGAAADEQNASRTTISNTSNNRFWETLEAAVDEMVKPDVAQGVTGQKRVIVNRESGLLMVRGTARQHELVQRYLDQVIASATRQVLIEATIVEVTLNDRYQAGINWQIFTRQGGLLGAGITLGSDLAGAFSTIGVSGGVTGLVLSGSNAPLGSPKRQVEATINLLDEFGDTQVLSSPKIMTLNNQPAVLKVVDNEVYFDIEIETNINQTTTSVNTESEVRTVAVGLVMNVTPQIGDGDAVTLNVRPTITRVRNFVDDPAVPIALAQALSVGVQLPAVQNQVPVVQVRETETVLRVGTGQLAILGGLMQDRQEKDDESVPGFSEIPAAGELFKFRERQQSKTELVVFLRPTVIRTPDVRSDLAGFSPYLPENLTPFQRQKVPFTPLPEGSE